MLYFIPWVIFLIFVVLAIPITSMLEKKKYRASNPRPSSEGGSEASFTEDEASEPLAGEAEAEMAGDADNDFGSFGDETPAGGDDFSAFEEEFK